MFPIRWNKAFRKKDGSISTIGAELEAGGGGGGSTLYRHDIILAIGMNIAFNFAIISDSEVAFTLSSLAAYLFSKGYNGMTSNKYLSAHGLFNNNRYFAIASSDGTNVQAFNALNSSATIPSSLTVYDAVIEL